jgi:isopenicillin N synthase-like dioxygenase
MKNLKFSQTYRNFKSSKFLSKKFFSSGKIIESIPVIDIAPLRSGDPVAMKKVGKQIDEVNKEIGFFLVKNTGIDFDHIQKTLKACEDFFLSPLENKMQCRIDSPPEYKPWGYFPRNMEQLQRGKDFDKKEKKTYLNDINEQFNMQNDNPKAMLPAPTFPSYPTEFKPHFIKYWKDCENLSNLLLKGFALGLDINENFFENKFDYCASALRVLHYPEGVKLQPGQFRASEHTDYGSLTVLYSTAPGLQVRNRKGEYIDVVIPWGHFVINIGDLMAFWTNDRWVSTPHRVIAKDNEVPVKRFSLAFFHNPNSDSLVECIPSCQSSENPWKYEKIYSGDFIMKKFKASIGEA